MNPTILAQTQRVKDDAMKRFNDTPTLPTDPEEQSKPPVNEKVKPTLKGLSKEETALLVGGGVLVLGLGVIVVANMGEEPQVVVKPPIDSKIDPLPDLDPDVPIKIINKPEPINNHHPAPVPPSPSPVKIPDEIKDATTVSDEQTFKQAFDAARHELGPGHVFQWHGTTYNTFTPSELSSISPQQHQEWIGHYQELIHHTEPIIEPIDDEHVAMNNFDHFSWTGIDKNGDGMVDVLIAKGDGHSPIVWADTDNDGKIDTRFDYDATSGGLVSSEIPPEEYQMSIVNKLHELDNFQIPEESQAYSGLYSIDIQELGQDYRINIATNDEHNLDIVAFHEEGKPIVLLMDSDEDGHMETGYTYHEGHVNSVPLEHPLEQIVFGEESGLEDGPIDIPPPPIEEDNHHTDDQHHNEDPYFNNHDEGAAQDFDMVTY